jgi:hypothetical protein
MRIKAKNIGETFEGNVKQILSSRRIQAPMSTADITPGFTNSAHSEKCLKRTRQSRATAAGGKITWNHYGTFVTKEIFEW